MRERIRVVHRSVRVHPPVRERPPANAGGRKLIAEGPYPTALGGFLSFGLGEVVEGVHELGGGVYAVDVDVGGDV